MILRAFQGEVKEVVDERTLKVLTVTGYDYPTPCEKKIFFRGTEDWIGLKKSIPDLLGRLVSIYGWEHADDEVEVFAIASVFL